MPVRARGGALDQQVGMRARRHLGSTASWLGFAVVSWACTPADPATGPSLSAKVAILAAGNGTVTASINPGGTLEIRITDPNLVGNAQVVALRPSPGTGLVPGVAWEGGVTRAVGCVKMALISLPNARLKHAHPHRVTYSDCQGRAAEGGRAADTNAVEV